MAFNKLVVYSLVLRVRSEWLCHQELLVTKKNRHLMNFIKLSLTR